MSARQLSDLDTTLQTIQRAPDDDAGWAAAEELAAKLDKPDDVAAAYRAVLEATSDRALAEKLGQRAVRFHEEWFGQDAPALAALLGRVLAIDPRSEWAFQRLTVAYTVGEKWSDLLALYDRVLAQTDDKGRQVKLLEEAYQTAKDLASDSSRAITYLSRLYDLERKAKHALALERLLEKHERWRELIDFWQQRLEHAKPAERSPLRLKVAETWLGRLGEAGRAMETLRLLFAEPDRSSDEAACKELERIAVDGKAAAEVRDAAVELLRTRYEASGRLKELVRVYQAALPLATDDRILVLHREAGRRLAELGEHAAAIEHYASLLTLDPGSTTTQRAMRLWAQACDGFARYAEAIAAAAERCSDPARKAALLSEAARTRIEFQHDSDGAITLLQAALAEPGVPRGDLLAIGRRLDELLAKSGRGPERLAVLERLIEVETVRSSRRALIGDVARLAEELGDGDRALAAWRRRLEDDASDHIALSGIIALLEREERWVELIAALHQRADTTSREEHRRADLVRIARIHSDELDAPAESIAVWSQIKQRFGADVDVVAALVELLTATDDWPALGELLDEVAGAESAILCDQLTRLGDAYRLHLDQPVRAMVCYRRALDIDLTYPPARTGLVSLIDRPDCRIGSATALGRAYRTAEDWPSFLSLTEARMASVANSDEALRILREVAAIEERIGLPDDALRSMCRALPYAPKDRVLEEEMIRLARRVGRYEEAVEAYGRAAAALKDDPHGAAQLQGREGALLEETGDLPAAHRAFFAVLGVDPGNLAATQAVVRIGSRLGRWAEVATAIVDCVRTRGRIDEALLTEIDTAARETHSYDEMTRVLAAGVDQGGLEPRLAAELHLRVAGWHRERRDDLAAAEAALERSTACDPTRGDALRELAALQRVRPGPKLLATLDRLADLEPRDLDVVHEAAVLASETLEDRALAKAALNRLLGRATAAWRGSAPGRGSRSPAEYVEWSVNHLVDLYRRGDRADGTAALDLLVDASRLPFPPEIRLALRHRGAEISAAQLDDEAGAIDAYRGILGQQPDDQRAIDALAALYQKLDRMADLLALRQHELRLAKDPERRLALRLDVSRIIDEVDRGGGRIEMLKQNLTESPGHEPSIAALGQLLAGAGKHRELVEILAEQAKRLEGSGKPDRAAQLWNRVAELAERELEDGERALAAYRRVIALEPNPIALDALARLHMERGEPAEAVPWLERGLASADLGRKAELSLRLARAHLGAGRADRAAAALERALSDGAGSREVRNELAGIYRQAERWEPLAQLLTDTLPLLREEDSAADFAREAAEIFHQRLRAPERALPALEKALSLVPDDKTLRAMMAGSLRVVGRHAEARALLEALIADFGRRRSKERALIHVDLALVARAEGKLDEAVRELEQASQMDVGNPHTLKLLAELSSESGKPEQAERSLRALLLVVRRQPPGDDLEAIGLGEVLFELHHIATARGEDDKAAELLDSALEAARQSDAELFRLRRSLIAHKRGDILARAVEGRLAQATDGATRAKLLLYSAEALELAGNPGEGLGRLLEALDLDPARAELHTKARELAERAGQLGRYVTAATGLLDRLRRKEDAAMVVRLALELGQLAEEGMKDLARARELYTISYRLSEEPAHALFALARVCGELGDDEGKTRALDELAALASDDNPTPAHADALYRLAQVQVASVDLVPRCLELVERALRIEPRYGLAGAVLRAAAEQLPGSSPVLELYERIARASQDPAMLLDFLERRAIKSGADSELVQEAVALADRIGEAERGERMLEQAVREAREGLGLSGAVWAAMALARRRLQAGELEACRDLLVEVAADAPAKELFELGLALAQRAAEEDGLLGLAAEVYELLREREPGARVVWEPLFEMHRRLGDGDRLSTLVAQTLPTLLDPSERNALRYQFATYLVNRNRSDEAIETLRDALLDDPDNLEVLALLEEVLKGSDNDAALADFLTQRFDDAKQRGNPDTITDVALRLGALLDRMGSADSLAIYQDALAAAPNSRELLRAVAGAFPDGDESRERAELLERLLAVEEPARAAALALELSARWQTLGDDDRGLEALEAGHRGQPDDRALTDRLEAWYREHQMWARLADMMAREAARVSDRDEALALLREAATIQREQLSDVRAAAVLLEQARALTPLDADLVAELATCLAAGGAADDACRVIGRALVDGIEGAGQVSLLLLRADLAMHLERQADALADLEQAYALDRERTATVLRDTLEAVRIGAAERDDRATERDATLRLARLLTQAGHDVHARDLLVHWIERAPDDRDPLHLVRDMDLMAERWDGVVAVCVRLAAIEEGEQQIATAMMLADAAERAGLAEQAQQGLELVHARQPGVSAIRDLLRRIYEQAGSFRELAGLLLSDAEHATDDDARYQCYRKAADLLVNKLGDTAAAIEPAQRARELKPDDHETVLLVSDVLVASGQIGEAVEMLLPAIENHKRRSPELAALQYRMSKAAAAAGDKETQLAWLKRAFDVDRKDGLIAADLAQLATELGDYELALKPLRAITLNDSQGPITRVMALLWEAKIEHARGNKAKAELWAKKALREDPSFAEAEEFLTSLAEP